MDFSETIEASSLYTGPAEGTLAPPMMWGTYGPPEFAAGQDNLADHASISTTIMRFGDVNCETPL